MMKTIAKVKGCELKAQAKTDTQPAAAELWIYGDIVSDQWFETDVSAASFVSDLSKVDAETITVYINSGGGSVIDGTAIYNALVRHEAKVHTEVSSAMSIAATIAMAGDTVSIAENGLFMIHDPWSVVVGDAKDMRKTADMLDTVKDAIVTSFSRSNLSEQEIRDAMSEETWYTAQEALDAGFVDEVTGKVAIAASFHADRFRNVPRNLLNPEDRKMSEDKKPQGGATPAPAPAAPTGPSAEEIQAQVQAAKDEAIAQARADEVKRREGILALFEKFPHHRDIQDACITDLDCTVDQAKDKLMDAFAEGPVGSGHIQTVADARDQFIAGAKAGLEMRCGIRDRDDGNPYRGFGMQDMARACAAAQGMDVGRMSRDQIIQAALMTTSDFPVIYKDLMHKLLLDAFRAAPDTWRSFCSAGDLSDFRPHNRYRTGTFGDLGVINEGQDPIPDTTFDDATKEQITALEHGYIFRITYRMIVDDDMGAFTSIARGMGRAAARSVENDVYALLATNSYGGPAMSDGFNLFSAANHANVITPAAISVAHLGAMRALMKRQMDVSSNDFIDLRPKVFLCPTEHADLARQVINSETDIAIQNSKAANPLRGFVEVVDTPRLQNDIFYLMADPADTPIIEVGFLNGNQQPEVRMEEGFDTRSIHYRITYDYGVAAMEWRAGVINHSGAGVTSAPTQAKSKK